MTVVTQWLCVLALVVLIALIRKQPLKFDKAKFDNALASVSVAGLAALMMSFSMIAAIDPTLRSAYASLGIPHIDPTFWTEFHPILIVVIALLAKDFADYWNHRAMHLRIFWPLHAVHHSDEHVNAFTTYRVHVFEVIFMNTSYIVIISWLGLPAVESTIVGMILLLHNAYVHMEVDWSHGPLRAIVASPRYHRWHHADVPEAHGKNLANIFPFYDILFGTYYVPGPCDAPLGARQMAVKSTDFLGLTIFPILAWGRMASNGVGALFAQRKSPRSTSSPRSWS